jgi:hypothetical protein
VHGESWLLAWLGVSILLLVLLWLWQGRAAVEYSDGVYAGSARSVLDGLVPYRDFAAAQPPGVYYVGASLLALGDSVTALRAGLAAFDLALAALVLVAVWRLTGRRASAVAAGVVALVTPWAMREHAQLLPETFGAPLLVGAMLAARDRKWSFLAGILGAGALLFKLTFLIPAIAIVALAAAPVIALGAMIATVLMGVATVGIALAPGSGKAFSRPRLRPGSRHFTTRAVSGRRLYGTCCRCSYRRRSRSGFACAVAHRLSFAWC